MHKVVIINTHGVTIVEGSQIHCMAAFNNAFKGDENPIAVYLYDNAGKMIDLNYFEGRADQLHARLKRERFIRERDAANAAHAS